MRQDDYRLHRFPGNSPTLSQAVHDEKNEAKLGDRVEIVACRPFSKTVTYNLVKIVERAHGSVELKDNVTEVEIPEKVGADAEAKAKKAEVAKEEGEEE